VELLVAESRTKVVVNCSPLKDEQGRTRKVFDSQKNESRDPLAEAMFQVQQEFAGVSAAVMRIIIEGRTRSLDPVLRQYLLWISQEALRNAFRHSGATLIEVHLFYGTTQLNILIRDNGCGFCDAVRSESASSGIREMRELSDLCGAQMRILSGRYAGTEVEIFLPFNLTAMYSSSPYASLRAS
jgi:nitrate/nitrite-specific signal transduction histidine kinase